MKSMTNKKIICFLLCVCMLLPLAVACNKGGRGENTDSQSDTEGAVPTKTVAVIVPQSASDAELEMANALKELCADAGYAATVRNDSEAEISEDWRILIGKVSSELSAAHYGELGTCGYGVKLDGTALSIAGTGEVMLKQAYNAVVACGFLADGGLFDSVEVANVKYDELIYAVQDAQLKLTVSGVSTDAIVAKGLSTVKNSLASLLKKQISVAEGEGGDIVFLTSERAKTKGIISNIGYNEYGITVKDGKIYLYSAWDTGLELAAKQLVAIMTDVSAYRETKSLFWPVGLSVAESADGQSPRLPYLAGAQVYDAAVSGAYTLSLTAEKHVFLDYADKIASLGYTLSDERTKDCRYMNDSNNYTNIYRTYINDDYMVYMYFMDYKNTVKVIGANIDEYEQLVACTPTEGNGTSTLSMLNIGLESTNQDYVSNGLSMAIKLSDGRFIVIDGGIWYSGDTEASEVKRLYKWLEQNSPDGKINIAAWIFTHIHVDHVNAAWRFEQLYGLKVNIERYMHNFVEYDHLLSIEGTDLSKTTYDVVYPRMLGMLERYDNSIMHTGQIYKIGNAEIEVVYTHEDFYPDPLKIVNNTSTIMRITVGGNSILVGGDAEEAAQLVCLNNNGYTLGSDFVQMTHHGFNGLLNYYKYAASGELTVALYPKNVGFTSSSANVWLRDNSDAMYMSTKIHTFELPYKKK